MPRSRLLSAALLALAILLPWLNRPEASAAGHAPAASDTPFTLSVETFVGDIVPPHSHPSWQGYRMTLEGEPGIWTTIMVRAHVDTSMFDEVHEQDEWNEFVAAFPELSSNLHAISIDAEDLSSLGCPFETATSEPLTQDPDVVFAMLNNVWTGSSTVHKKFQPIMEDAGGPLPRVWSAQCPTWEEYEMTTGLHSAATKWKPLMLLHDLPSEVPDQDELHYFSTYSLMAQAIREQAPPVEAKSFFECPTPFNPSASWARWLISTNALSISIQGIGIRQPWLIDLDWLFEQFLPGLNNQEVAPELLLTVSIESIIYIPFPVTGYAPPPISATSGVASIPMEGFCAPVTVGFTDSAGNPFVVNGAWSRPGYVDFRIPRAAAPGQIQIQQVSNAIATAAVPIQIAPVIWIMPF